MKIYIVKGSTGEYSDYVEWLVKAFLTEKAAQTFVEHASSIAKQIFNINQQQFLGNLLRYTDRCIVDHPMDPKFQEDYTGTSYTYEEIELEENHDTTGS